jgi:LysM repeat protein
MKKINESTLASLTKRLRDYLKEAGVTDGSGNPVQSGAAAPAAAPAPSAAGATPGVPANAKEQNYQTALQQIKGLYAKAQVPYPPTDKIVQSRYGLPDPLPPIDQWDGTMPKSTGADFLTRNLFGRQASKDTAAQQAVNDKSNAGNAKADAAVAADMEKLKTLVAQLKGMAGGAGVAAQAAPAADPNAPRLNTAQVADAAAKGMAAATAPVAGGNGTWSAESINETISRLMNTVRLLEAEATPAPAAGGDKAEIIKQIQAVMADINAQNENPPADVVKALSDAQAAIDAANAAPAGSAALDGTKPGANPATTIPGGANTAVGGAGKVNRDDMSFNQAFAAARSAGEKQFTWKGKTYGTELAKAADVPPEGAGMIKGPTAPEPYVIKSGDNLTKIAKQMGVSLQDLMKANPQLADAKHKQGNLIWPGEKVNPVGAPAAGKDAAKNPVGTTNAATAIPTGGLENPANQAKPAPAPAPAPAAPAQKAAVQNNANSSVKAESVTFQNDELSRIVNLVHYR